MCAVYFENVNKARGIFINKLTKFPCLSLFPIRMEYPTNDHIFEYYQREDEDPDASQGFYDICLDRIFLIFCKIMWKTIMRLKMITT